MTTRHSGVLGVAIMLAGLTVGVPRQALGQDCGSADATMLDTWGVLFFDDAQEPMRTGFGIPQLAQGTPSSVVTDTQLCRRVVRAVEQWLRNSPAEDEIDQNGWDYSIYEYGTYVIMPFTIGDPQQSDTLPPPTGTVHAFKPTMIPIFERNGNQVDWVGLGLW